MQPYNGAENLFLEEIRDKKRETALLRTATQHKRLGAKKVLFATDLMSRKEKLKHTRAGKVMTQPNLYEDILPIAEFEKLETYEKRNRLQYWRSVKSAKEIQAEMGTNSKRYYEIIKELDLPKAPRTKAGDPKPRKAIVKRKEVPAVAIQSQLEFAQPETQPEPQAVQQIIINGLNLEFNGTFTAEQIIKQFLKFGTLLEGEDDKYYIELRLQQKPPQLN
jgi:hypothetical protein